MSYRHYKAILLKRGRNRKPRPKTFNTEESATSWAEKNKIKKYTLQNLKSPESKQKKIRVVVQ